MKIGRSVCVLTALLAVTLAGTSVHAQAESESQETPFVQPADVTVEPVSVESVDPDELSLSEQQISRADSTNRRRDQAASAALLEQVEVEIAEARRRALRFESAFDKVQRQFVQTEPGEQATVDDDVLERFERDLDGLETRFDRVESGFRALGEVERAQHATDALEALDTLKGQLALLGLRLEKRGERARVANALEFDFELLVESLEALHGPVVPGDREFNNDIIRPPEGVEPSGEIIRPPEGLEPTQEIIRPPTSDNPAVSE
jgi:hypothetical protein